MDRFHQKVAVLTQGPSITSAPNLHWDIWLKGAASAAVAQIEHVEPSGIYDTLRRAGGNRDNLPNAIPCEWGRSLIEKCRK